MKEFLITITAACAVACAGSADEHSSTAEQRERMDDRRAEQERADDVEGVEPENTAMPNQFDKDGDGEVESAELKQAGVMEGAIEGIEADRRDARDAPAHASDAEISDDIREKLAEHDDLSVKAKNVRISTANGKVTLRGPVESADEKSKVESCAREVAGADVDNRLEVAP
jgi:hypothetical protein